MTSAKRPRGTLMGEGVADPLVFSGRAPRVLVFHGFTGTPQEVALVVDVARELGLGVEAPLLPGHGARVSDLAPLRFSDWLAAAEDGAITTPLPVAPKTPGQQLTLREFREGAERTYIIDTLKALDWNISKASVVLGVERTNLHKKIRAYGIKRGDV